MTPQPPPTFDVPGPSEFRDQDPKERRAGEAVLEAQRLAENATYGSQGAQIAADRIYKQILKGRRIVNASSMNLGVAGAVRISEAFNATKAFLDVRLPNNKLGSAGVARVAEVLGAHHGTLRRLDLSNNRMGDGGATLLAESFGQHTCLEQVWLAGNRIGNAGSKKLADLFTNHRDMQQLFLGDNRIGDAGIGKLAVALGQHRLLRTLNLEKNNIGPTGGMQLAQALLENSSLEELYLSHNSLGDEGAARFAEVVGHHEAMTEIHFGSNGISDKGASPFAETLETHQALRCLWFDDNNLSDRTIYKFVGALSRITREGIFCNCVGNPSKRWDRQSLGDLVRIAKTVKSVAMRGVTLGRLMFFYKDNITTGLIEAESSSTRFVVNELVKEDTRLFRVSFAETFDAPRPQYYIIHSWDALFRDLVYSLAKHATGDPDPRLDPDHVSFLKRYKPTLQTCYYIDAFCNDHNLTKSIGDPRCQRDKFHLVADLIHLHGGSMLIAMDTTFKPLTRLWCLYEVAYSINSGMNLDITFCEVRPVPRTITGRENRQGTPRDRRGWGHCEESGVAHKDERAMILFDIQENYNSLEGFDGIVKEYLEDFVDTSWRAQFDTLPEEWQEEFQFIIDEETRGREVEHMTVRDQESYEWRDFINQGRERGHMLWEDEVSTEWRNELKREAREHAVMLREEERSIRREIFDRLVWEEHRMHMEDFPRLEREQQEYSQKMMEASEKFSNAREKFEAKERENCERERGAMEKEEERSAASEVEWRKEEKAAAEAAAAAAAAAEAAAAEAAAAAAEAAAAEAASAAEAPPDTATEPASAGSAAAG